MPHPKLISSPETKAYYEVPLRHVMPDLEGYDEIYLIHERDYQGPGINALLKQGSLISQLQAHDPKQFEALQDILNKKINDPDQRRSYGTGALSVETGDLLSPFRAGVIFISGEGRGLTDIAPHGLSKQQQAHIAALEDTPRKRQEGHWIVFDHEVGHLVKYLAETPPLLHEIRDSIDSKHPTEISGDDYAGKINQKMIAAGDITQPNLYNSIINLRTITGGQIFSKGHFTEYFTGPFMPGKPLENVNAMEATDATSKFGQSLDADLMKRLIEYRKNEFKPGSLDTNVNIVKDALKKDNVDPVARKIGTEYIKAVDEEFKSAPAPAPALK